MATYEVEIKVKGIPEEKYGELVDKICQFIEFDCGLEASSGVGEEE